MRKADSYNCASSISSDQWIWYYFLWSYATCQLKCVFHHRRTILVLFDDFFLTILESLSRKEMSQQAKQRESSGDYAVCRRTPWLFSENICKVKSCIVMIQNQDRAVVSEKVLSILYIKRHKYYIIINYEWYAKFLHFIQFLFSYNILPNYSTYFSSANNS